MALKSFQDKVNFIFGIADALRGPYKPNQYGKVILPLAMLRRMDCVLDPTKQKVLDAYAKHKSKSAAALESILNRVAKQQFHNTSKLDFAALKGDANQEMGYIFEKLIRKYNEDANETAGDHFTPREVIRLMVNIICKRSANLRIITQKLDIVR